MTRAEWWRCAVMAAVVAVIAAGDAASACRGREAAGGGREEGGRGQAEDLCHAGGSGEGPHRRGEGGRRESAARDTGAGREAHPVFGRRGGRPGRPRALREVLRGSEQAREVGRREGGSEHGQGQLAVPDPDRQGRGRAGASTRRRAKRSYSTAASGATSCPRCRPLLAYVDAQREYYLRNPQNDKLLQLRAEVRQRAGQARRPLLARRKRASSRARSDRSFDGREGGGLRQGRRRQARRRTTATTTASSRRRGRMRPAAPTTTSCRAR